MIEDNAKFRKDRIKHKKKKCQLEVRGTTRLCQE